MRASRSKPDLFGRLHYVSRLTHDIHPRKLEEQPTELAPCERLIVDNHRSHAESRIVT
jgi:hypothetical protein